MKNDRKCARERLVQRVVERSIRGLLRGETTRQASHTIVRRPQDLNLKQERWPSEQIVGLSFLEMVGDGAGEEAERNAGLTLRYYSLFSSTYLHLYQSPYLKLYTQYIQNFNIAVTTMSECSRRQPSFASFLEVR
jgi:hypothetical protein